MEEKMKNLKQSTIRKPVTIEDKTKGVNPPPAADVN